MRQFEGGQSNPTYYLAAGGREYVLRRKPPGKLLPSAHAVDREYRIMTALAGTGVPVPRTYVLCDDASVIGTAFYIMECVHGPHLRRSAAARGRRRRSAPRIYDDMNDGAGAPAHRSTGRRSGLGDFGRPGNYVARQIHRWTTQYRASETEKIDVDGAADRVAAGAHPGRRRDDASSTATTGSAT